MATGQKNALAGAVRVLRLPPPPLYEPPGLGRLRKIALIGTAETMCLAPFHDPSWEIWSHSSCAHALPRADRVFDLHPKAFWIKPKKWHRDYVRWLRECPVPIYMQKHYPEIPQSIRYPRERILAEFRRYFTSQTAWMIALALTEGVTHLGFFGIHYAAADERTTQRWGCEYWMGQAEGRGVQLVLPVGCPLLRQPTWLYGYENYRNGEQLPMPKSLLQEPFDARKLTVIDMDSTALRPPLATIPNKEPAWDRSGHAHHF